MIYLQLLLTFFKIGLFTVGGGYAMLPMIQEEVQKKGWMTMERFIDFIAVSESTPGPFAVNTATYIGTEIAGLAGALCATLGVILPSFIIIMMTAKFYTAFKKSKIANGFMSGLKPAVVGLIGAAVISTGRVIFFPDGLLQTAVLSQAFLSSALILTLMLFLLYKKANPILIIIISAGCGIISGYAGQLTMFY